MFEAYILHGLPETFWLTIKKKNNKPTNQKKPKQQNIPNKRKQKKRHHTKKPQTHKTPLFKLYANLMYCIKY